MNHLYLEKIKNLSKIQISKICDELKINRSNLLNGKTTEENEKKVYEKIIEKYEEVIKKVWFALSFFLRYNVHRVHENLYQNSHVDEPTKK